MSHPPIPLDDSDRSEAFLRTLVEHERWLAAYVYSLVASTADAEDILQECKVVLWKKFNDFTPGSNFRAWARTIALHQILNYRRSEQRRPWSPLDQAFLEAVAAEIERRPEALDRRAEALRTCVQKLPHAHRAIVQLRYFEDCSIDEIATRSDRSAEAVYRLLSRIRKVLNDCVSREVGAAPSPT